jgi:regulator of RNase E activity RraA
MRGIEGVIVDGACRDVDEAFDHDFAVYGSYAVPLTARGRVIETGWNEPVSFGGLTVAPGDLVIADSSGVVFVTAAQVEAVLGAAEEIVAREHAMADAVRERRPMAEVMGANYERLLERA